MRRVTAGWIITGTWCTAWLLYVIVEWSHILTLRPNEAGDFIAGLTAPLAFLWLVIGYFQHGEELRQNTEALKIQGDALKQQVEEYKALVRVTGQRASSARKSHQFERDRVIRSAQPVFVKTGQKLSPDRTIVGLKNMGSTIQSVTAQANGNFEVSQSEVPIWERDEVKFFTLLSDAHISSGEIGTLTLQYCDEFGVEQECAFPVHNNNGRLTTQDLTHQSFNGRQ